MEEHSCSEHVDGTSDIKCADLTQTEQRSLIFHLLYAIDVTSMIFHSKL